MGILYVGGGGGGGWLVKYGAEKSWEYGQSIPVVIKSTFVWPILDELDVGASKERNLHAFNGDKVKTANLPFKDGGVEENDEIELFCISSLRINTYQLFYY